MMNSDMDVFGPWTDGLEEYACELAGSKDAARQALDELAALARQRPANGNAQDDKLQLFRQLHAVVVNRLRTRNADVAAPDTSRASEILLRRLMPVLERESFSPGDIAEISGTTLVAVSRELRRHRRTTAKRVFMIEDEYLLARELQDLLESNGFVVLGSAATETSAVDKMRGRDLDLILADVSLKDETSGIVAANRIRGSRDIPIIYLTANAHLVRPLNVSKRDFVLEKPLDPPAMVSAIKKTFARPQGRRQ